MYKLLLVSDKEEIRSLYRRYAEWNTLGFEQPAIAENAQQGIDLLSHNRYDAISSLLSVSEGKKFFAYLSRRPEMLGMETARDEERLRAAARHFAGDDTLFLLYPFDLALFRTQLRARLVNAAAPLPVSRALTLNTATRRVSGAGGEVRLSVRECAMLAALGRRGTLSRADAAALFGSAAGNVVDVYACYLRKKLAAVIPGEVICARRGAGYALADGVTLDVL